MPAFRTPKSLPNVGISNWRGVIKLPDSAAFLSTNSGTECELQESVGIDGYVGNVPYSVKPDTYKTMGRLSETIAVKMIYYTKTKTGLTIEVEK